jgi:lipopolysaccharide/colanic/teichoic acid biosynthesis glycosyltransferase
MNSYPGKRVLDILVGGTACAAFVSLAAGISAISWMEDRGSPLFRQTRLGKQRRPFTIFKFRTMRAAQVTRIGRWLRETGVDELPQFINVLRGEMSIVGPRPLTEHDINRLGWAAPSHDWRFSVKPGITGLSQLLAGRGARASERFDKLYLQRQSLSLDLRLIALSFAINVAGKKQVRHWIRASLCAAPGGGSRRSA